MSKQLVIWVVILMSPYVYAQHLDWSYSIGGSNDDRCYDVAISNSGNIYLTGATCPRWNDVTTWKGHII